MTTVDSSRNTRCLLKNSCCYEQDGWLFIHLEGSPFQIGYQNGYLSAESANTWLSIWLRLLPSYRDMGKQYIWDRMPLEYRSEIEGISAGLQARGYAWDKWDVLGGNIWADYSTYKELYNEGLEQEEKGGCSAFIATGNATTDGQIVMGHNTWCDYNTDFACHVVYDVIPDKGYRYIYQSAGGSIWSGRDWYINSAGLMVTETTLRGIKEKNREGIPVFVRARKAVQYAANIDEFIRTMTTKNSGAYTNEWLVGDANTGEILSLQLGANVWDINRTFNGFFGSSNHSWGEKFREEAGSGEPDPTSRSYARYIRWGQLKNEYYGRVNVEVGKRMLSDHYDTLLRREAPSARTICGHRAVETAISADAGPRGAYDAKLTSSSLVLNGMAMWARWGYPCGMRFDVNAFLDAHQEWAEKKGPEQIQNLYRSVERTPNLWTFWAGKEKNCTQLRAAS